jgi:hypothetical protein
MYIILHVKYPLSLTKLEFFQQISNNPQMFNFMKPHQVEAKLFHADEWMGRHTHTDAATLFSVSRYSTESSTIKGLVAKKF